MALTRGEGQTKGVGIMRILTAILLVILAVTLTLTPAQGHTELRFFESQAELGEWQKANLVESMGEQRCIAEALEMQRRALRDGYQVSFQALFPGRTSIQPDFEWEMVNSTFIGLNMYFFSPTKAYYWKAGNSINGLR